MTQEAVAILAVVVAVGSLVVSVMVFMIQRRDMRRRELWWAIVEDNGVEVGVPMTFRLYRYIGKDKPNKKRRRHATAIRGYVLAGEALIGRERMSTMDAMKHVADRHWIHGEINPEVPDEVHPPKITMVPLKVIRYGG